MCIYIYIYFSVRHQLILQDTKKRVQQTEQQRKKQRVLPAAAERAATNSQLADRKKRNGLSVRQLNCCRRQLNCCRHQLQQAITNRYRLLWGERMSFRNKSACFDVTNWVESRPWKSSWWRTNKTRLELQLRRLRSAQQAEAYTQTIVQLQYVFNT